VATLTLVRATAVDRYGWLSDEEFTRIWALCQAAPGINLLALTTLLGKRLAGARGILFSLVGLLFPSFVLTVLATALYSRIRNSPLIGAALRGVIPATVGLGLWTSWQMASSVLKSSRKEGPLSLLFCLSLLAGSGLLSMGKLSVTGVLLIAAFVSAGFYWSRDARKKAPEGEAP
jgi:chromate transporter